MRIACFECLPLPPSLAPCPAPAQPQAQGTRRTRQTVAPSVRFVERACEATADEPRLTLEFPVGPKVELRALASN